MDFAWAKFTGGWVRFGAEFSSSPVSFVWAQFANGEVVFDGAKFLGADVTFAGAVFSGAETGHGRQLSTSVGARHPESNSRQVKNLCPLRLIDA